MAFPRMSFRTLQQRLGLLPVAAVLCVSLIAAYVVHERAREELYQSGAQLARGLASTLGRQLSDELSDIRRELSAWARFFVPVQRPLDQAPAATQADFQNWLRALGQRTTSRYDVLVLVDADGRIVAINETALSDSTGRRISSRRLLGQPLWSLTGVPDETWIHATLREGRMSGLSWRQVRTVNELYDRIKSEKAVEPKTAREPRTAGDLISSYQIVVAVPVLAAEQSAKTDGALVGFASWSPFQQIVDEAALYFDAIELRTGYGFLFDSGGDRIIAHKMRDPNAGDEGNLLGKSVSKNYRLPQVRDAAAAARREPTEYDFPTGNKKFAVFTAIDPASTSPAFAFDWRLGIGVDYSDIFAPMARLRATTIGATIALACAVALVNVWLARRLSLSVREFTRLVSEATEGRFRLLEPSTSHDEISDLGSAWNRLLVSMREDAGVQPIPNPYVVGTPVRSAHMFFGREEDLRWIADRLHQPGNELVVLYGQRRIGKTSLIHQVRHGRAAPDLMCFFIDTHSLLPSVVSDDDFYASVGRIIVDQAASYGRDAQDTVRTAADLRTLIKSLNEAVPQSTVVILFDELEALETRVRDGLVSTAISSFLVSLLESELRVSMIVTGSSDGTRLTHPFWATLAPKSIARNVRLLSRAEGLRLITEPVGGQIEFEDMLPERILRLTGSHPYYTQTVCQRLVDLLNERHSRRASAVVLEQVVERLLTEPPLPLDDMWCNLSSTQRWILAELGRLLQSPESTASADSLWVNADAGALGSPTSIGSELRRLTATDILEETAGSYRFAVDFVRLWIRKEQRWWEVARERMGHAGQRQSIS